tara:strand:+ start:2942 stop:3208 length:267 start_codon:yes stop_codon:yes gene_type:complete
MTGRTIPYVDVLERIGSSGYETGVAHSYAFPDFNEEVDTLEKLRDIIENHPDETLRLSQETRLYNIVNVWHTKNFIKVSLKHWKYDPF